MKHFITAFITAVVVFLVATLYYRGLPSFTGSDSASVVSLEAEQNGEELAVKKPADMNGPLLSSVKARLVSEHGENFIRRADLVITKVEGGCARGNAAMEGGGLEWFAVKDGEDWNLIWDGNGYVDCSNLSKHPDFSTELIPECWDNRLSRVITR